MRRIPTAVYLVGGLLALMLAVTLAIVGVNSNERQISERPTEQQVRRELAMDRYRQRQDVQRERRRICRGLNDRFGSLRTLVQQQQPTAQTTDYYRTHPRELARVQAYFKDLLQTLAPVDCLARYPPPRLRDYLPGGNHFTPPKPEKPLSRAAPSAPQPSSTAQRPLQRQPRGPVTTNPPTRRAPRAGASAAPEPVAPQPGPTTTAPAGPSGPPPSRNRGLELRRQLCERLALPVCPAGP